jgi:hypothetical protein
MNLIDQGPLEFARAEAATLRDGFADVVVIGRGARGAKPGGGNVLLLASQSRVPDAVLPSGRDVTVLRGDGVRDFAGDAGVLTDEHAPADQMLSPRR